MPHFPPSCLRLKLCLLIIQPLKLLYPLVMIVHSNTQHLLCPLLSHHELVQMLFQCFGCYPRCSYIACSTQRAASRLTGLVYTCETLT